MSTFPSAYDAEWMQAALRLAVSAERAEEVPVGAVVVSNGKVIGEGYNRTIVDSDPAAHAEIIALRSAAQTHRNHRLPDADLYVTLEPCAMCAGAIVHARIRRVVFGAYDPKSGAAGSVINVLDHQELNHRCQVTGGVLQRECADILQRFFKNKRT